MFLILIAAVAAFAVLGFLLYYGCSVPHSQLLGRTLVRGRTDRPVVALTFDDGPAGCFTERILDVLREHRVPATFFVCGRNAERLPELVRRMKAEHHAVGNHTYSHPLLYLMPKKKMADEIDRTQALLERITGSRPSLFRPPYGARWFGLFSVLRARGLATVMWSNTGYDWIAKHTPEDIARLALKDLRAGAVILLHDGRNALPPDEFDRSPTLAALPAIIEGVRNAGLQFVRVDELLAEAA
jgi:peptidoglycan/xylan/chitin deacetylase (PgdA/CDA1 family)